MEITESPVVTPPEALQIDSPPPAEVISAVHDIIAEARRRPATLSDLTGKKARELDVVIASQDDDGTDVELVLRYRALSSKEYDDLVAKYPPTPKQKADGMPYNPDTFGPALVAAVCIEPVLSIEDVTTLMKNPSWSTGEVATLTGMAMAVCQTGAGVPFTERG